MSFENVVANPGTTIGDRTASMGLDDGSASVGQQVYFHLGTKQSTGNPVQKAGLANGQLYGIKALGVNQNEYQQAWHVGDQVNFSLVDVSAHAGVPGTGANTLEGDSQAGGVTNFQRPEDGSWDPEHPNDFYFVTTSSFGARPDENRTGETRLWRLHFNDLTDPSQGGKLKLLVSGPVGTADSPSATGTQSAGSPGPQMLDNITVNDRGQVIMLEDVGNQAYRGGVWIYDIGSGSLTEIAIADPDRFTPGAPGFVTKDEEASGVIPAPFLGADAYLLDEQVHKTSSDSELVEGGQYMELHIPPGKKF
jgi:secreted PhoX family phosphatase